jgi:hypothetical protein
MSYFRLYPTKQNTIFHYYDYNSNNNSYSSIAWSEQTNAGANPVMELMDGKGESKLVFSFDLPEWLFNKLKIYDFQSHLQLWDAGTLFAPGIKLKNVTVSSFVEDFAEGDGYSFLKLKNFTGVSNWLNRQTGNLWSGVTFTSVTTYDLNTINEDLNFNVSSSINNFVNTLDNPSPKYTLNITSHENDVTTYTKFIHSKYTKTIFQPYLEFFIQDEVKDCHSFCYGGTTNKLYLLNKTQADFTGTLTAEVTTADGNSTSTPAVIHQDTGVYYINVTPAIPRNNLKNEHITVVWKIDGNIQYKKLVKVQSPNQIFNTEEYDLRNLYFYMTTPYTHNIVRHGDVMPFFVVSQIRGYGNVLDSNYEYKVVSMDGFEMVPWSPVSIYIDKLYFNINTEYFFPEQQYEVFLRNRTNEYSRTSHLSYKFKVSQDGASHLRSQNASPYFSRDSYFSK